MSTNVQGGQSFVPSGRVHRRVYGCSERQAECWGQGEQKTAHTTGHHAFDAGLSSKYVQRAICLDSACATALFATKRPEPRFCQACQDKRRIKNRVNSPTPASKRNKAMFRAVVTTSTSICQVSTSGTWPRRGIARYPVGQQVWNEFRNGHLDVFEGLPQAAQLWITFHRKC